MVSPFSPELVNPASLDVRLGDDILVEQPNCPHMVAECIGKHTKAHPYRLRPGQFILAHTLEKLEIPEDISAQFLLKSSRAREGLEHLLAGYIDPGFSNSVLTLELTNARYYHSISLWPGMKIGQLVFQQLAHKPDASYIVTGNYNDSRSVCASKGHL